MPAGNPYTNAEQKREILRTLKINDVYYGESISIDDLQRMLPNSEIEEIDTAVSELVEKEEAPLHYCTDEDEIYLSGKKSVESYLTFLRSQIDGGPWYQ